MSEDIKKPNENVGQKNGEISPAELEEVSGGAQRQDAINNYSQALEAKDKLGNTQIQR